jgi:hypothetical protein
MMCKTCPSCGGDLSGVRLKRKLFTQFVSKVVRCPQCKLRTTVLTIRENGETGVGIKKRQLAQCLSALRDSLRK